MQLGAPPLVTSLDTLEIARHEQRGLVTRSQCLAAGLSPKAVEWRLASHRWRRVLPGVYQTNPGRDDWWTWALAALLAFDDSACSHERRRTRGGWFARLRAPSISSFPSHDA